MDLADSVRAMAREAHPATRLLKGLKRHRDGAVTVGKRVFHPKLVRGEVVKVKRVRCNEVDDFDLACLPDDAPLDHTVDTRDWVVRFEGRRVCYSDSAFRSLKNRWRLLQRARWRSIRQPG
jgi:hypothetical protein